MPQINTSEEPEKDREFKFLDFVATPNSEYISESNFENNDSFSKFEFESIKL